MTSLGELAEAFDAEIRTDLRYEAGLVWKALAVLAVLAVILLAARALPLVAGAMRHLGREPMARAGLGSGGGRSPGR